MTLHDLTRDERAASRELPKHRAVRRFGPLLLVLAVCSLSACRSPVGVRRTGFEPNYAEQRASVLDQQGLSIASRQLISYAGLTELYADNPDEALHQLLTLVLAERRRRPFASMAELHHARGQASGDAGHYLLSAVYGYYYLFSDELEPPPDPYDPLFRLTCDLYNRGMALALLDDSGAVDLSARVIETPLGPYTLEERRPGFPWGREEFSRFLPANAYSVRGVRERVRQSGVGVPLIAVRNQTSIDDPLRRHIAPRLKLAATAILKPEGGIESLAGGALSGDFELYFPTDTAEIEISGKRVPLEADWTAPLAHSLENSPIWGFSLRGFREGGDQEVRNGVYMTQPYQQGKIPVLLVHGTASTPAQWTQLLNGLQLDPRLRSHYQLWVGLYHTGNPVLYSAWNVRQSLAEVLADLDPHGTDEQLRKIVVIGHSQGGLVARLLISTSGEEIWKLISDEPFEDYELSPEAREILSGSLFFDPHPNISRVVFISTPHRGSFMAASWIGQFARDLVELPQNLKASLHQLKTDEKLPAELRDEMPTSVQNMDPDSRFVKILAQLPMSPNVELNSIVSVTGRGPFEDGDDGVVEYSSAHLEEAESEYVIRHGHSCQNEPATVLEVRRILLMHLRAEQEAANSSGGVDQ